MKQNIYTLNDIHGLTLLTDSALTDILLEVCSNFVYRAISHGLWDISAIFMQKHNFPPTIQFNVTNKPC